MIGKICGTGSYLPDYIIDNFKLAESVDTSDEWIQERTGIRQRHIAKKETTSYMASMAAPCGNFLIRNGLSMYGM